MWCSSMLCQHVFQPMWQHESEFRIKRHLISLVSSSDFEKSMFCFYVPFTVKLACCHSFATEREMGFSNLPVSSYSPLELFLMWTEHMSECSWRHKIVFCFGAQRIFTRMFPYLTASWCVCSRYCFLCLFCTPKYGILVLLFALELLCGKTHNSL